MLMKVIKTELLKNKYNEKQETLQSWIGEYEPIVIQDLGAICSNRYLLLETLLRIIDNISLLAHRQQDAQMETSKPLTKLEKKGLKVQKKCEYLIFCVFEHYDQGQWGDKLSKYCEYLATCRDEKQKTTETRLKDGILLPKTTS